jgi:hypothetical protein
MFYVFIKINCTLPVKNIYRTGAKYSIQVNSKKKCPKISSRAVSIYE